MSDGSRFYTSTFGTPFGVALAILMASVGFVVGLIKLWQMFF